MEDDLRRVGDELLRVVVADGDFLTEIASHLILAGGKRVRPGFAIAASSVLDPHGSPASLDVIRGGCAVELVHIGSLYHDDVMDDATSRRSVKSVNAEWGNLRAILAGDYLLGRASQLAAALGTEVAGLLATTITELCEGQILELESAYRPDRTIDAHERSIAGKTAALLATACRTGALVAGLEAGGRVDDRVRHGLRDGVPDRRRHPRHHRHRRPAGEAGRQRPRRRHLHAAGDPLAGRPRSPPTCGRCSRRITPDERDRARELVPRR
ncbi:MAG: polyprenyl synthetase family protein [Acidimicrobiales bacterium]